MSSAQLSQSEDINDRLRKKLKVQAPTIQIDPTVDITQLALDRYQNIKHQYNFVSFDQSNKAKTYASGKVEAHSLPIHDFNQQMYKFRNMGFCNNPDTTTKGLLFSDKYQSLKEKSQLLGQVIDQNHHQFITTVYGNTTEKSKKQLRQMYKQKRQKGNGVLDYQGPWAGYGQNMYNGDITQQQKQLLARAQEIKQIKIQEAKIQQRKFQPYSIFHWGKYEDYKGLSYVQPPINYRHGGEKCFLPKKQAASWITSQKEGLQVVRFFPKVGHFILVGNPQGKVHLFDIVKNRTCAHTYIGHVKAIRDIQFSHDGKHFLSGGFDNKVLFWDTQHGKVGATFNLKKIPFTIKFHADQRYPHVFFCGSSSKKIYQFDLRTGQKMMQYNQHLGTVNTLTFIQQNKFISSSDDKKLFIWQYGVPVVTRHVSEPQMHTITATAMHPSGQYFAGQSSDNQIVIYENKGGNFRRIRSKTFASHYCAGYACAIDFSYDGQFLLSGDQRGKLYFYDWKTSKVFRVLDGHSGACIGLQWHPSQPTTVASCGWQGTVKLWT